MAGHGDSAHAGYGRRAVFLVVVVIASWLAGAAPPAAAQAESVLLPTCGNVAYGGEAAPETWSGGCTGGSLNMDGISWSDWGAATAVGIGVAHVRSCDPTCVEGPVTDFPTEIRVSRIRRCASPAGPALYYTRWTATYLPIATGSEDAAVDPPEPYTFEMDSCPDPGYLVGTGSTRARFGAFEETGGAAAAVLETYYGEPTSTRRGRYDTCLKRWATIGLRVRFGTYGLAEDACEDGFFFEASLTDRRWHTAAGVRPGGSARLARRAAKRRRCPKAACPGVRGGYVLAWHRSECAVGRFPGVVAETVGGRVKRLIVYTYGCE